jgi:hypothetical protein
MLIECACCTLAIISTSDTAIVAPEVTTEILNSEANESADQRSSKKVSRRQRPGRNHLTEQEKKTIIELHESGLSFREIGRRLDRNHKLISMVVKKWQQHKSLNRTPGSGRPRKTTPQTDEIIRTIALSDGFSGAAELLRHSLVANLSRQTIKRRLTEGGEFKSYWSARKLLLTAMHKSERLAWCQARVHWSVEKWSTFLWTDDTPYVIRYQAKRPMSRRHNERYIEATKTRTFEHDIKISVWGCFSAHGVGSIVLVDGVMDQSQYVDLLQNEMLPSAQNLFGNSDWILQQDCDINHTSISTSHWLGNHNVQTSEWPVQSPDLNPIENLWSILEDQCARTSVKTAEELFKVIEEEWYKLPVELLEELVHSMPRRCQAVIDVEGGMTMY